MTMCSRHDITEIRLNVALNTNQSIIYVLYFRCTMERVCFVYLEGFNYYSIYIAENAVLSFNSKYIFLILSAMI